MLAVDIIREFGRQRVPPRAGIAISNIRGGRLADYAIVTADVRGQQVCRCELLHYPRWSEPVSALLARSVSRVQATLPREFDQCRVAGARVRISIVHAGIRHRARTLAELTLVIEKQRASVTLAEESLPLIDHSFHLENSNPDPLQLLVVSLSQVVWRCNEPPTAPLSAPDLPRFQERGQSYIRVSDLPPWTLEPFKRYAAGRELNVRGESEACYDARAWDAFLGPQRADTASGQQP